jgi:hypothetical protein
MALIFPLPGQSRTWRDRYCKFSGVSGTKAAANAQPEGVTRWIFFDPSLSFDPTTLESRSSAGAEALASPPKKWSAQLSYSATMTEMDRRHKRSINKFLPPRSCQSELPDRRNLTQIGCSNRTEQA